MRRVVGYARVSSSSMRGWVGIAVRRLSLVCVLLALVASAGTFAGCAVKLAPDYDKAIFDGLTKVNVDTMKLFASARSGAFSSREKVYIAVLGELDALQVQVASRSTPTAPPLLARLLTAVGNEEATKQVNETLVPPTAKSIVSLSNIVTIAQRNDRNARLSAERLEFLKESFATQMAQTLTYEKALQR